MVRNFPIWLFVLLVPVAGGLIFTYFGGNVSAVTIADITTTVTITVCGNGIKDAGEQCDGADLNSQTCIGLGYDSGTLSCRADCDFNISSCVTDDEPPPGGGGGGGGGYYIAPATKAVIQGKAYPKAQITILKDGSVIGMTIADSGANFKTEITNITAGTYTFGVWAEDSHGRRSITFSFTTTVGSGTITTIGGIFIPPTIELSDTFFKAGEILNILGQTAPESEVDIFVNSDEEITKTAKAAKDGAWLYAFNTALLEDGSHTVRAKAASPDGLLSTFSHTLAFSIGTQRPAVLSENADLNGDHRTNLIDFSILLYNWGIPKNPSADLNSDGKVSLIDFSIMLYHWTG